MAVVLSTAAWANATDGGSDRVATPTGGAASADEVAFESGTRIEVIRGDGAGRHPLTSPLKGFSDAEPQWSPRGNRLAFIRWRAEVGAPAVFVVGADGRGLRRLSPGLTAAWAPDGTRLAVVRQTSNSDRSATVWSVAAGRQTRIGAGFAPTFSPTGRLAFIRHRWYRPNPRTSPLYWDHTSSVVIVADRNGRNQRTLIDGRNARNEAADPETYLALAWSPDGRVIAVISRPCYYDSDYHGSMCEWYILRTFDATTGRILMEVDRMDPTESISWSPDGTTIAFWTSDTRGLRLETIRSDGSQRQIVTRTGDSSYRTAPPAWRPDGRQLAFVAKESGRLRLIVVGADGSGRRSLAPIANPGGHSLSWRAIPARGSSP